MTGEIALTTVTGNGWSMHPGDCLDVLRAMGDGSVDHVITDPPYEANCHSDHRRSGKGGDAKKRGVVERPIGFAAMTEALRGDSGFQIGRLARRWSLVFCQSEAVERWAGSLSAFPGCRHVRSCVWVKPDSSPQFSGDRPAAGFEFIECVHGPSPMRWNGGGKRGVFTYGSKDPAHRPEGHETPKPLPLMLELVELFTDPGDTVLDPFAGSGTTGVACLRLGRRFIGCELDPKYFALACDRLRAEETGSTLRDHRAGQIPMFGGVK